MVYIITGRINSGKTTLLTEIFQKTGGDGFILPRAFYNGEFTGYNIRRLTTGEEIPIIRLEAKKEDVSFRYKKFLFLKEGIAFAERVYQEAKKVNKNIFFIDEIGPVELEGKGFFDIFKKAIQEMEDVYVAVRDWCIKDVIEYFGIGDYEIIKTEKERK